jgi:hypothetical protein
VIWKACLALARVGVAPTARYQRNQISIYENRSEIQHSECPIWMRRPKPAL